MDYQTILYEVSNGIGRITLNRPEVYNACNEQMTTELFDALSNAASDELVRCVILTGAGKAFCSGQDLKEAPQAGTERDLRDSLRRRYNPIVRLMRSMPKPIIAGINGVAAGAGLSLALAADVRIMSTNARLVEAFIAIALIPDSGATFFYPRMLGYTRAFEFATLNKPISADEAYRLGLVTMLASPRAFPHALNAIATKYAQGPTQTYGYVKMLLQRGLTATLDEMLELEEEYQQRAGSSDDYREGVAAFREKRQPKFQGR
ncbi:MAG: enoyl-CoA hydratase-related protein [Bacteroidota bacterium]|nr:enoyl-CoA hydratase-related protein [Candidatus Kapabacteria bacterium]MCS7302650.1 enoyl-CoA hydratase-related protein [Candidatus Kapabacteria bacterium]MCX7936235.1 enoyl-CoA hydratase-related protein [Chlorobiota bacterium]MDW8074484.1 enoyl-CoA hydratase-related protein [Bacteroidota bacterium]MDW8271040.1 enoyl-CoA hydratase-related protein [Bacteroidota bacterium]